MLPQVRGETFPLAEEIKLSWDLIKSGCEECEIDKPIGLAAALLQLLYQYVVMKQCQESPLEVNATAG